jgi:hypothetical protein
MLCTKNVGAAILEDSLLTTKSYYFYEFIYLINSLSYDYVFVDVCPVIAGDASVTLLNLFHLGIHFYIYYLIIK